MDLHAGVSARQVRKPQSQRRSRARFTCKRQRDDRRHAAGAADGQYALLLGVDVDEPPRLYVRQVGSRYAQHADLLVVGQQNRQRRMGQRVGV